MNGAELRAVLVDHAPVLGGAQRSLLLLTERLPAHGIRVEVVTHSVELAARARAAGARVHELELPRLRANHRPWPVIDAMQSLRRLLATAEPTVAVANTPRAAPYVAAATRRSTVPFVWYVRDFSLSEGAPAHPRIDATGRRALQAAAHTTIAVSHAVAGTLPSSAGVVVIHNGAAIPDVPGDGSAFRLRWHLPPLAPVVGVLGRLRPWKGQDRFLEAMAAVAREHRDARFVVAGTGVSTGEPASAYERRLRRLSDGPALRGRVTLCGWVEEPATVHGALDVLVHPGDPEPFGLAVVEAMSHAVAVAGYAHGALPELIEDGRTGVLVAPGDVDGLARAVTALLEDGDRRVRIGAAARDAAVERFDADLTACRVANCLRGVVGRR